MMSARRKSSTFDHRSTKFNAAYRRHAFVQSDTAAGQPNVHRHGHAKESTLEILVSKDSCRGHGVMYSTKALAKLYLR